LDAKLGKAVRAAWQSATSNRPNPRHWLQIAAKYSGHGEGKILRALFDALEKEQQK
jgi:hypothetical protein